MPDPPFDAKQKYWGFDAEAWVEPLAPPPPPPVPGIPADEYALVVPPLLTPPLPPPPAPPDAADAELDVEPYPPAPPPA